MTEPKTAQVIIDLMTAKLTGFRDGFECAMSLLEIEDQTLYALAVKEYKKQLMAQLDEAAQQEALITSKPESIN